MCCALVVSSTEYGLCQMIVTTAGGGVAADVCALLAEYGLCCVNWVAGQQTTTYDEGESTY